MNELMYASWDGDPVVLIPGEAWACQNGQWKRVDDAVVGMEARLLPSKIDFDDDFPDLPGLPSQAFKGKLIKGGATKPAGRFHLRSGPRYGTTDVLAFKRQHLHKGKC